jgi:hypothetical protein
MGNPLALLPLPPLRVRPHLPQDLLRPLLRLPRRSSNRSLSPPTQASWWALPWKRHLFT